MKLHLKVALVAATLGLAAMNAAMAAGAAQRGVPAAPAPAASEPAPAAPATTVASPVAAAGVQEDYVIGPGDSLNVLVIDNPNLSLQGVSVRPDGKITTPLVEDMIAIGKSPSQLARDMEGVLSQYLRTPQVSVIVAAAVSTYSQVQVVGQVRDPKALPFRRGLKVLDVVLAAGGLTEFAAPNRARIVRQVDGKNVDTRVKLGDLLNKGDLRQNLELKPGDVLIIPQSLF